MEEIYETADHRTKKSDSISSAEIFLISANIESAINDHLLSNGTLIYPKTRVFLANLREVVGAMARRAKDSA